MTVSFLSTPMAHCPPPPPQSVNLTLKCRVPHSWLPSYTMTLTASVATSSSTWASDPTTPDWPSSNALNWHGLCDTHSADVPVAEDGLVTAHVGPELPPGVPDAARKAELRAYHQRHHRLLLLLLLLLHQTAAEREETRFAIACLAPLPPASLGEGGGAKGEGKCCKSESGEGVERGVTQETLKPGKRSSEKRRNKTKFCRFTQHFLTVILMLLL